MEYISPDFSIIEFENLASTSPDIGNNGLPFVPMP